MRNKYHYGTFSGSLMFHRDLCPNSFDRSMVANDHTPSTRQAQPSSIANTKLWTLLLRID